MSVIYFIRVLVLGFFFISHACADFSYGIAMHGDLKYGPDFDHFDYVNAEALAGGDMRFSVVGTFDSLNPFLIKGSPPPGLSPFSERLVFEQLMCRAWDEPFSLYGWVAEKADMATDRSSITFQLNPQAQWGDGKSITTADVAFTFNLLKEKGTGSFQLFAKNVQAVDILSPHLIRFTFKKTAEGKYDREAPLIMAMMSVLPQHLLEGKNFEKMTTEPLPGSGPYEVDAFKFGQQITYKKRPHWWAANLPVNKGRFSVDRCTFDYYRNLQIEFEAFKSGHSDFYAEKSPVAWAQNYTFPAIKRGQIKKLEFVNKGVQVGMKGFVFNTRRPLFKSRFVRQALSQIFNFSTLNKTLYQGQNQRIDSYFVNTDLASKGRPQGSELEILKPFEGIIPDEVFQESFTLTEPVTSIQGREIRATSFSLLEKAGWKLKKGVLTHVETKKPFTFEILLYRSEDEKIALSYAKDLKKLGIQVSIRVVDPAQYENRTSQYDYDMIIAFWGHTLSPGNEQTLYWHSRGVQEPHTRNYAGVQSPAVDGLCQLVSQAKTREDLITAIHALDRVLLWGYYVVPLFYQPKIFLAHQAKFGHPEIDPKVGILFTTWWYTPKKEAQSKEAQP